MVYELSFLQSYTKDSEFLPALVRCNGAASCGSSSIAEGGKSASFLGKEDSSFLCPFPYSSGTIVGCATYIF